MARKLVNLTKIIVGMLITCRKLWSETKLERIEFIRIYYY